MNEQEQEAKLAELDEAISAKENELTNLRSARNFIKALETYYSIEYEMGSDGIVDGSVFIKEYQLRPQDAEGMASFAYQTKQEAIDVFLEDAEWAINQGNIRKKAAEQLLSELNEVV